MEIYFTQLGFFGTSVYWLTQIRTNFFKVRILRTEDELMQIYNISVESYRNLWFWQSIPPFPIGLLVVPFVWTFHQKAQNVIPHLSEKNSDTTRLIGVFWLRAGNDRLDVLPQRGVNPLLRRILCCWSWFYSLDDHGGTLLSGSQTSSHVHCRPCQLDSQLLGRHWISEYECKLFFGNSFFLDIVGMFFYIQNIPTGHIWYIVCFIRVVAEWRWNSR